MKRHLRRLWTGLVTELFTLLVTEVAATRAPDFVVGKDSPDGAYLRRWYLIPRNRLLNVYLHKFMRDDDDRALHDHPWAWCSLLLAGSYIEHTIAAGGVHRRRVHEVGSLRISGPWRAHRIELPASTIGTGSLRLKSVAWTLFITGPRLRRWGFHCPDAGWVDFARFTRPGATGEVGRGCD